MNFGSSSRTLVFLYSKDNCVDKKAFFQIVRMVWLLDDHWHKQHRSYAMAVEQRVILKVPDVMNLVFIFKHIPPICNDLFVFL